MYLPTWYKTHNTTHNNQIYTYLMHQLPLDLSSSYLPTYLSIPPEQSSLGAVDFALSPAPGVFYVGERI